MEALPGLLQQPLVRALSRQECLVLITSRLKKKAKSRWRPCQACSSSHWSRPSPGRSPWLTSEPLSTFSFNKTVKVARGGQTKAKSRCRRSCQASCCSGWRWSKQCRGRHPWLTSEPLRKSLSFCRIQKKIKSQELARRKLRVGAGGPRGTAGPVAMGRVILVLKKFKCFSGSKTKNKVLRAGQKKAKSRRPQRDCWTGCPCCGPCGPCRP